MKYPWMPLFWGDLLANIMHLSTHEAGAYLFLIGHAWEHQARIAVVDLQRVTRVNNYMWRKVRPRLEPFFNSLRDPNFWISERVEAELIRLGKISNERKAAALQMHSKSRASASILHMHPLPQPIDNLDVSKVREAQPIQNPGWRPRIDDEVRSPPRTKSDNVLQPIPEKPKRTAGEE